MSERNPVEAVRSFEAQVDEALGEANPWAGVHLSDELRGAETPAERARARRAVAAEYAGAPGPLDCECGQKAHYRATIGAMKCPHCGALYRCGGGRVR